MNYLRRRLDHKSEELERNAAILDSLRHGDDNEAIDTLTRLRVGYSVKQVFDHLQSLQLHRTSSATIDATIDETLSPDQDDANPGIQRRHTQPPPMPSAASASGSYAFQTVSDSSMNSFATLPLVAGDAAEHRETRKSRAAPEPPPLNPVWHR